MMNMDMIRKRKRMLSNRESARRSRQRKQQHLDDLTAQVSQIKSQNGQILASINATTQLYLNVDAENSVLRAQLDELSNRLQSLNDIINCLTSPSHNNTVSVSATVSTTVSATSESDIESFGSFDLDFNDGFPMDPWAVVDPFASHPLMPSALDAFMC